MADTESVGAGAPEGIERKNDLSGLEAAVDQALRKQPPLPALDMEPPEGNQPVLVVVAGAKASGAEAIASGVTQQFAKWGKPLVSIGGEYQFGDLGWYAVEDYPRAERDRVAARFAAGKQHSVVLRTPALEPYELYQNMKYFKENGYRIHFAGVVPQEDIRRLNSLQATLEGDTSGQREMSLPFSGRPGVTLGLSAEFASKLGAKVHAIRGNGVEAVNSPALQSEPFPVFVEEAEGGLHYKESLRAMAKATLLAAKSRKRADHVAIKDVTEGIVKSSPKAAQDWKAAIDAALGQLPHTKTPRWGAGRRARNANGLITQDDAQLQTTLEKTLLDYSKAAQHYRRLSKEIEGSIRDGREPGGQLRDAREAARKISNKVRDNVFAVVTEAHRRAPLTKGQRQREIGEWHAQKQVAAPRLTGTGHKPPGRGAKR